MWNVENFCKETFQWLLHLTDLIKIGVGERNLILKVRLKKHTSFTPIWKGKAAFQAWTSRQGGKRIKPMMNLNLLQKCTLTTQTGELNKDFTGISQKIFPKLIFPICRCIMFASLFPLHH